MREQKLEGLIRWDPGKSDWPGALNLGREISDPVSESRRRLAAIMFTDMVGYSAIAQADEAAALAVLERHNRILRPIFPKFRGREVKTVGDAFLVEFESALDAARCALELQQSLHDYNASAPDGWKIQIRVGIHVGDVVESDGDVLGDAVNIASRIEPLAEPGGICLTQQVYDQVHNKIPTPLTKLPPVVLKNIRVPMSVYRVVPPWGREGAGSSIPGPAGEHHLAVLPLVNISPDPNDGYFADGLTEELISQLSQVRDLRVVARTSVAPYKSAPKSIAEVGAELGVDTVLEGSVRKAGNRIRITLQLIDVPTQGHIWASNYDRNVDDVFAVQTDIAERTARALRLELSPTERPGAPRAPTANIAAYDEYLRGLVAATHRAEGGFDEAVRHFERATSLDPTFAEAYAAWANLYVSAAGDHVPMREVMPRARELVARALELDSESSEAHSALANLSFQFDQDWERAEGEFQKAISLNPSNVSAHQFLALLLIALERFDEAKEVLRRVIRLDPGGRHRTTLAWVELESGNFQAAIENGEQERDKDPSSVGGHVYLGIAYLAAGRRSEALKEADTPVENADDEVRFDHALLNAMLGRSKFAREVVAEAERGEAKSYTSSTHLAMLYAAMGEKERALDLLEKDFRQDEKVLWLTYRGMFFDPIRDDPRFVSLLRQYRLPVHPIRRPIPTTN
jgi:adenylate cyclase